MALRFQPPDIRQAPTKEQALLNPINNAIQTLPAILAQHYNDKREQELKSLEMELKKRELMSKFGTGLPAPLGPVAETPEEELARLGSEPYARLHPTQYFAPGVGPDGKPTFTPFPAGGKPGPALPAPTPILSATGEQVGTTVGKPTVLPKPNAIEDKAAGESAEAQSIADNAIAELNRIRPLNEKSRGGLIGKMAQKIESKADPDKPSTEFTNTADVINSLKGMVVSVLKSTFGGQLSDGEREYLNEVYGAVEGMSRAERKIAMDGVERTLRNAQKRAASKSSAIGGGQPASSEPQDNDPLGIR